MFIELESEKALGGQAIFVNLDRITSAFLSVDGRTVTVAFAPGDHHAFQGEENVKKLLAVLRPGYGDYVRPQVPPPIR